MSYKIRYTKSYQRRARKFLKQHPELKEQYRKTLKLLEVNPHHPSIRLHKLTGKFKDLYAVSINIRYRIVLHFIFKEDTIVPISVGSHGDVYGQ